MAAQSTPRRPPAPGGFLDAWQQLVGEWKPPVPERRGRKPRVPLTDLLPALTYHVMQQAGTLGQHFTQLFGTPLADSSWSDRRQRLPWEIFAELMRRVLRARAQRRRHPDAFWRGWRLLALDGTQFSLTNTPQITTAIRKSRTRRGRAAFAKMTTAVLLEIGWHNPVAAAIGRDGESEWALAWRLLAQLPKGALLLADRLYGCPVFAAEALAVCARVGSHCLLRARRDITRRVQTRYPDGSRLIRVPLRDRRNPNRIVRWLELREIRVTVRRRGHRSHELRLWTSLRDPRRAPALELAQLYARRWEHELYFRAVKRQLRRSAVLHSHTLDTAAQEIAALILVSALLANERARAAAGHAPVLRVSFGAVLDVVKSMWLTVQVSDGLLSDRQITQMLQRGYRLLGQCVTPERRGRSCPRAVRQPVRHWPRLLHTDSVNEPPTLTVI